MKIKPGKAGKPINIFKLNENKTWQSWQTY
jgi:hypothetical protein